MFGGVSNNVAKAMDNLLSITRITHRTIVYKDCLETYLTDRRKASGVWRLMQFLLTALSSQTHGELSWARDQYQFLSIHITVDLFPFCQHISCCAVEDGALELSCGRSPGQHSSDGHSYYHRPQPYFRARYNYWQLFTKHKYSLKCRDYITLFWNHSSNWGYDCTWDHCNFCYRHGFDHPDNRHQHSDVKRCLCNPIIRYNNQHHDRPNNNNFSNQ
ncbi:hypothetical protein MHYP_G00242200 [Metynnis hypsauchen]